MSTSLREARRGAGLSTRDVAATLGVHPTTVHRWERLERRPAPGVVTHLAETFRADRNELMSTLLPVLPPEVPTSHRGTGLRSVRHGRGVSVARIGAALGVPPHTVYNWESGRARIPADRVEALAELFSVPRDELLAALRRPPATRTPTPPASPLRRLWSTRGWSQAALARAVGVSRTTLRDWEHGRAVPPWSALRRLARTLGVPLATVAQLTGRRLPTELDPRQWRPGTLARVLLVLRQWSDLTQTGLARLVGCSVAAVRSWERGDHAPSAALRTRLETLYRLHPGALLSAL